MKMMTVPVIFEGSDQPTGSSTSAEGLSVPLSLIKYSRDYESAADYFGIQYLYKSGYSPKSFISFIQKVWPPQARTTSKALSRFPPAEERLEALRKEIQEILPQRTTAITNTQGFATFRQHLLALPAPIKPSPKKPTLLHPDKQNVN